MCNEEHIPIVITAAVEDDQTKTIHEKVIYKTTPEQNAFIHERFNELQAEFFLSTFELLATTCAGGMKKCFEEHMNTTHPVVDLAQVTDWTTDELVTFFNEADGGHMYEKLGVDIFNTVLSHMVAGASCNKEAFALYLKQRELDAQEIIEGPSTFS